MGTVKYSGPIASFRCPTNAEIRSLKVHFSPKQEGTGDPSPENVREIVGWNGVEVRQSQNNLFNENSITYSRWTDGAGNVINNAGYGCISEKIRSNSTSFTLIAMADRPNSMSIIEYDSNGNFLKRTHGNQVQYVKVDATWSSTAYIAVQISDSNGGTTITPEYVSQRKMMLIEGTDDPVAYEPYHGSTTNYEFGVLGKNKFDYATTTFIQGIRGNDGEFVSDSVSHYTEQFIPVIPSTEYTLSGNNLYSGSYVVRIYYSDANKNWISKTGGDRTNVLTFTTPSNCYYIQIQTNSNNTNPETWQLELGSTATAYEPYDPNNTVYGGWVDLVSGDVCEEWTEPLSLNAPYLYASMVCFSATHTAELLPNESNPTLYDWILDCLPKSKMAFAGFGFNARNAFIMANNSSLSRVGLEPAYIETDGNQVLNPWWTEWYESLSEPPKISCTRKTPITYHLAPTQLQTFLGQNNVWSNADYVEVEYDLHETQDILARKQFIIANQPHIEQTSDTLVHFKTDISAPLKECKVHFSPKQEGSGDPSPENAREVVGWNSIQMCLPSEYQRVEYIQNPEAATAHINTGIIVTEEVKFQVDFQLISSASTTGYFMGQWADTSFYLYLGAGLRFQTAFGCTWANSSLQGNNQRHMFTYQFINGDLHLYDGETEILKKAFSASSSLPICVAGPVVSGLANKSAKTFSSKIWKNGTLIQDLIPCVRKSDSKPGMYDTVTKTFYTNAGTGEFICGPDVNEPSLLMDWTDEAGTVYGGYIDLVNGELVETYKKYNLGDLSVVTYGAESYDGDSGTNAMYYITNTGTGIGYSDGIEPIGDKIVCAGKNVSGYYIGTWSNPDDHIWEFCINANNQLHVVFDNIAVGITSDMTFAQRRAKITEWLQNNPITVVVPRQTPIRHPLTPTQLKTLKGINNIWSDANGPIEVKYWTH